jgi:hypothetical protein
MSIVSNALFVSEGPFNLQSDFVLLGMYGGGRNDALDFARYWLDQAGVRYIFVPSDVVEPVLCVPGLMVLEGVARIFTCLAFLASWQATMLTDLTSTVEVVA